MFVVRTSFGDTRGFLTLQSARAYAKELVRQYKNGLNFANDPKPEIFEAKQIEVFYFDKVEKKIVSRIPGQTYG